jgi:hypothetical protein
MTRVTVSLPDDLARQAQDAGLLDEQAVASLLRRALRERRAGQRLGWLMNKLDATAGPPMTDTEVADEVAAARREHARRR